MGFYDKAGIAFTPEEKQKIEIADFNLGELERTGVTFHDSPSKSGANNYHKTSRNLEEEEGQLGNVVEVAALGADKFLSINERLQELENRKEVLQADLSEIKMKIENENLIKNMTRS